MDSYYDTEDFALTKNDIWLRKRGEMFELKIPAVRLGAEASGQYQEITGEMIIREIFAIAPKADFLSDIAEFGYAAFCELDATETGEEKKAFLEERKKVLEYIKEKRLEHYRALVAAGIA